MAPLSVLISVPAHCTWWTGLGVVFKQALPHCTLCKEAMEHPQGTGGVMNTSFEEVAWSPGEASGRLCSLRPCWLRFQPRSGQGAMAIWKGWCVWVGWRCSQNWPVERKFQACLCALSTARTERGLEKQWGAGTRAWGLKPGGQVSGGKRSQLRSNEDIYLQSDA